MCIRKVKPRNLTMAGSVLQHKQTWTDKMYPYNLMYVVTHGGDMWTASCNAWKAVRALARWLIVTKHRKLLKAIKISSENRAAALLRTAFLLSSCPTQCGYDPAAPQCFLAPQMSHWLQQDCGEAGDCWLWRWLCRIRAAHGDRSVLLLQCRKTEKKKTFFDEIVEAVGIYWTSVTLSMQLAQFAVASNSDIVQAVLLISAWTLKTLSHYQLCALFQLEEPW